MKSPRFDFRAMPLRKIFSAKSLERVWRKKVRVSLKRQALVDGIEHFDFHLQCEIECKKLSAAILAGDYIPSKVLRVLSEKSKGLCRQIVIPSVADALVLQCLSDALYSQIKDKAPTAKAFFEPQDHRFSSDRDEYGTFAAWLNFQEALFQFSRERNFVVVTDVANYYDSISCVHLRNVISSIAHVEECVLDMLIFVLSHLLWQPYYSPRVEIGLPQMNLDAPRLLAHCLLYELDTFLSKENDHDFVRFMDDIDIGVETLQAARKVLRSVDLVLQTRQLRLNAGKTRILTRHEAEQHFRISDNAALDELNSTVDQAIEEGGDLGAVRKEIKGKVRQGIRKAAFDGGSGDKILKRWLGLAARTQANIATNDLSSVFLAKSAVRPNVLRYISATGATPGRLKALADCATSGHFVDDAAMIDLCNSLIETKIVSARDRSEHFSRIANACDVASYFGLHCRILMQSKYESTRSLLDTIRNSRHRWAPDDHLGRLIGSLSPLFKGVEREEYVGYLEKSRNTAFRSVVLFHQHLSEKGKAFNAMFPALRVPNQTRGTGITHAKFLCLLSALGNPEATDDQKRLLRQANNKVLEDVFYRRMVRDAGVEWTYMPG